MRIRLLLVLTLAATAAIPLSAHDFWLAATNWTPSHEAPVTFTAGIGEHFPARTPFRARNGWLADWRVIGAAGEVPVTRDFLSAEPVMSTDVTLPAPGAYLGVAVVTAQTINMTAVEFTDYLEEEGLDHIVAAREKAGESSKAAIERYARYAKIATRAGGGSAAHLTKPAGLKAEFVPATDPTSLQPGQPLTVQFLVDGRPVAGATVMAVSEGKVRKATSDADGRATFTIDSEGAWLVKTIHMVRLPATSEADWESFWATLSFHTAKP